MENVFVSYQRLLPRASSLTARVFVSSRHVHLSRFCPHSEPYSHLRRLTLSRLVLSGLQPCRLCAPPPRWLDSLRFSTSSLRDVLAFSSAASRLVSQPPSRNSYASYVSLHEKISSFQDLSPEFPLILSALSSHASSCLLSPSEVADWVLRHSACGVTPPSRTLAAAWDVFAHAEPSELNRILDASTTSYFYSLLAQPLQHSLLSVSLDSASPLACAFPTSEVLCTPGDALALVSCLDPSAEATGTVLDKDVPSALSSGILSMFDDSVPLSTRVLAIGALVSTNGSTP